MKVLRSLSVFVLTIISALAAFTYVTVEFPVAMRNLLASVDQFRIFTTGAAMFEDFHAWLGILLWPSLVVFIGFASAVHLVINLGCIFFGLGYFSVPRSSNGAAPGEKQPISRW